MLRQAGQHLAKFRASQALIIQIARNTDLFPCARLCAKHITCVLPTATFLWSKVYLGPRSQTEVERSWRPRPRRPETAAPRGQDEAVGRLDAEVGSRTPPRADSPRPGCSKRPGREAMNDRASEDTCFWLASKASGITGLVFAGAPLCLPHYNSVVSEPEIIIPPFYR